MRNSFFLLFFLSTLVLFGSHIVGGEIIYLCEGKDPAGNDKYKIILKVYRDCKQGNTAFDGTPNFNTPALITVREVLNGVLTSTFDIGVPQVTRVPPSINNRCVQTPNDVCVEEGYYSMTITLPPKAGGYYVIYQRCCRNSTILNLFAPSDQGSTYYTKIPGPEDADCNNSPRFNYFPPIFLCANKDFTFDHSAFDPDGDRLEYSFYTPFQGGEICCPAIGGPAPTAVSCPPSCPQNAPSPPYVNVTYVTPYDGNYPMSANPGLSINSAGLLTGRPDLIGQFVVGICVKEYRGNTLLNVHLRDFQFNIRACVAAVNSGMAPQSGVCEGLNITFTNTSTSNTGQLTSKWDFGVTSLSDDTSLVFNPSYAFPDTGKYLVTLISNPNLDCSDTIKRIFNVYPPVDINFPKNSPQCFEDNLFNFRVAGTYSSGTSFAWNFGATASPSVSNLEQPPPVIFQQSGWQSVLLKAKFGPCEDTHRDSVRVIGVPPQLSQDFDTTIVIGQTLTLNADGGSDYTYTWTPVTDYLNCNPCHDPRPESYPTRDIVYQVVTHEPNGCFTTTRNFSVFVEYKFSVDVPTAFSPNGDGVNDVIFVDGWGIKKLLYFKIFNRWGQLLFESNDLKIGWDGKFNSVPQNMETYIYQAAVESWVEGQEVVNTTGSFRLIR